MRKLMWFSVGFGAACAFGAYFYVPWLAYGAVAALFVCALLFIAMRWVNHLRIGVALFLGLAMGFGWFSCYDAVYLRAARNVHTETCEAAFEVTDFSYETSYGCAFDAKVTLQGSTYNALVYLNAVEQLEPGDRVAGTFSFRLTTNGTEEDPTYHQGKGVFLIAYQEGAYQITNEESVHWSHYPAIWRQKLSQIADTVFPEDVAGFAKALLLGDRSGIDYETNTTFKVSGISHIIAVSGLHVSILFGLIFTFAGRRRFLTVLMGIPAVVVFMAVVGFTPSVTRAGIMQILMMIALVFDKDYDSPTALACAALLMLAGNPLVITSVSFRLSTGCMAGR